MINSILVEICCGTIDDCLVAINNQVDRIELNSALELGGLTPSLATLIAVKQLTDIPIACMVRTRTAGFLYSEAQYQVLLHDAEILLKHGADAIVFGFLKADNQVDSDRVRQMTTLIHSYDKEAVFHKAFDECPDLDLASEALINCQVDRVLTSGGFPGSEILAGAKRLRALNCRYGDQLTYLPGGGVNADNIRQILDISGCTQIHMTAKQSYHDLQDYVAVDDKTLKTFLSRL